MEFNSKYGEIKIFTKTVEQQAISQVLEMANSPLGENAHIRIMPDCHAGAGRLYSRSEAKRKFTVEEYAEQMKGIFSTCINESTLDEAPFAYKDFEEIMECIEPTVRIVDRMLPIYNFKAN